MKLSEIPRDKRILVQGEALALGDVKVDEGYNKRVWAACGECGEERWVLLSHKKVVYPLCRSYAQKGHICSEETKAKLRNNRWAHTKESKEKIGKALCRGGRLIDGYRLVKVEIGGEYIRKHRLVMEQKLGRPLLPTEKVHHINGVRDDNREENLELISPLDHGVRTLLCKQCSLVKENKRLWKELKLLTQALQLRLEGQSEAFRNAN